MRHPRKKQSFSSRKALPKHYSQNGEDLIIYERLKKGTVLEIGANSGTYLSNSKLLIEKGFTAYLLEPGETYNQLKELHKENPKVHTFNIGIATEDGIRTLYHSGEHELGNGDIGLVSTLIPQEMERWVGVEFTEMDAQFKTFKSFWYGIGKPKFDFISIDVEGLDYEVLSQINLKEVGCKLLCIEWNGNQELRSKYNVYCEKFGLKPILRNPENIIYSMLP